MRILIVNDDGINAPGLALAEELAAGLAGPEAEIWVVAPELERSGASHAISYVNPMRMVELAPRRYAVEGFPADCALVGMRALLKDTPPDLVISGVNRGHNLAEDVVYSGTVGAAMDAALNGAKAIALSQAYAKGPGAPADLWDPARAHGVETLRRVLALPWAPGLFYNVNFPPVEPAAAKGIRVCPQGIRNNATYDVIPHTAPNGREFHYLSHRLGNRSAEEGSDAALCADGWITVTPCEPRLTAHSMLAEAEAALGADRTGEAG